MVRYRRLGVVLALSACLLAGIAVRYANLVAFFDHPDSTSVASAILRSKAMDIAYLDRKLVQDTVDSATYGHMKTGLQVMRTAMGAAFFPLFRGLRTAMAVPMETSYAPLQFFLTALCLHPHQDLTQVLFWGRLPSLLGNVLMMVLMILLCRRLFGRHGLVIAMALVSMIAFSWVNIITSLQMFNYALGAFSALVLIYFLVNCPGLILPKSAWYAGLLITLLCWASYQMIFFAPAFFAAYFWDLLRPSEDAPRPLIRKMVCSLVAGLTPFVVSLAVLYVVFISFKPSLSYGRGPQDIFLFPLPFRLASLSFFFHNAYLIFLNLFQFSPHDSIPNTILSHLLLVIGLLGVYQCVWVRTDLRRLRVFVIVAMGTYLGFVIAQQLAFGPSRHSFVLFPFLLLMVGHGLHFLLQRAGGARVVPLISLAIAGIFFSGYATEQIQRRDVYHVYRQPIETVLAHHDVDIVVDYHNDQKLIRMRELLAAYPIFNRNEALFAMSPHPGWFGIFPPTPQRARYAYIGVRPLKEEVLDLTLQDMASATGQRLHPSDLQLIYDEAHINTDVDLELSPYFFIGSNSLYIYIFEERERPPAF